MSQRRVRFDHDGHRFDAVTIEAPSSSPTAEDQVAWVVRMDDAPALEFHGGYPYRDEDVRRRVLEWYEIQKPVERKR